MPEAHCFDIIYWGFIEFLLVSDLLSPLENKNILITVVNILFAKNRCKIIVILFTKNDENHMCIYSKIIV
jgi:hypothetical protein